ncbi:MAG TPA: prepilin-type N-terminal cleavage/methylation domain-containing protein [Candidatus Scybalomonas excrementigallinarum]|nr:prepilin-type N-terminal cleavage/methylation domain-containing protein [Candidatus Scybalomonas excrementigallinarum]
MHKNKKKTMRKLKSDQGFTLVEMVLALFILSLIVTVIGGGVTVVKSAYEKITLQAEAQVLVSTFVTAINDELRQAEHIEQKESNHEQYWSFYHAKKGYRMYFVNKNNNIYYKTEISTNERPLVSDKTITNGLLPQIEDLTYENHVFTYTLRIYYNGQVYEEQEISIRPLNEP